MVLRLWGVILFILLTMTGCAGRFERGYIQGCTSTGMSKDVCSCAYDKFVDKYSEKALNDMDRNGVAPEGFMEDSVKFVQMCMANT